MRSRKTVPAILAVLAVAGAPLMMHAQPYPSKPVHMIPPFPPGGGNDALCRIVAQRLSESLASREPAAAG